MATRLIMHESSLLPNGTRELLPANLVYSNQGSKYEDVLDSLWNNRQASKY
jgi:hypothetical protein